MAKPKCTTCKYLAGRVCTNAVVQHLMLFGDSPYLRNLNGCTYHSSLEKMGSIRGSSPDKYIETWNNLEIYRREPARLLGT